MQHPAEAWRGRQGPVRPSRSRCTRGSTPPAAPHEPPGRAKSERRPPLPPHAPEVLVAGPTVPGSAATRAAAGRLRQHRCPGPKRLRTGKPTQTGTGSGNDAKSGTISPGSAGPGDAGGAVAIAGGRWRRSGMRLRLPRWTAGHRTAGGAAWRRMRRKSGSRRHSAGQARGHAARCRRVRQARRRSGHRARVGAQSAAKAPERAGSARARPASGCGQTRVRPPPETQTARSSSDRQAARPPISPSRRSNSKPLNKAGAK